jgi:nucleoside-diphosphate-sugar epimerase
MMRPHVLIIGCGDLGRAVAHQLIDAGYDVTGVKRSPPDINDFTIIQADVTEPSSLDGLSALTPQIIIYCVAAGGQTDAQYKAAYVDGLKNVLDTQAGNMHLQHVFYVSSTRVYGQHPDQLSGQLLDEHIPAIPTDFGGERLLQGEQLLIAKAQGKYRTTILRLSGIYGPGRLRMLRLAESGQWPEQDSWSNRIHRDDAAAFMVFLIQKVLSNTPVLQTYIVTDCKPVTQYEVLAWLASQLKQPIPNTGAKADPEVDLSGKRLSNKAMLASGYVMQYPDYQAGYSALIVSLEAIKGHA